MFEYRRCIEEKEVANYYIYYCDIEDKKYKIERGTTKDYQCWYASRIYRSQHKQTKQKRDICLYS